jgi:hypothetical protein
MDTAARLAVFLQENRFAVYPTAEILCIIARMAFNTNAPTGIQCQNIEVRRPERDVGTVRVTRDVTAAAD